MAQKRARTALLTALAAAAASVVAVTAIGAANATPPTAPNPDEAAMVAPVEDFTYPDANRIQQEQKILLKKGDGNITLVPCDGVTDIMVKSRTGAQQFCFDVKAKPGYLTLELADAFGIFTEDYPVKATITAEGEKTVINAPANDYVTFGEATEGGSRSVLVELRVTG
ncbi:hypothetical protein C6N75_24070 [Streptomyces solincola]|uniref:Secreted protein n=1 Tax=Streptomyces solincola TaxID=2100817 RepID=A0A2S9PQQ6_9ACTN|nr:hypothetical protein C6N75_24070 [Streptomyces solincola]